MTATTAFDLIKLALKVAGPLAVGQTPSAEDANDALALLNSMLASWQQKRLLVYHMLDVGTPATGARFYTIGPGGDFDAVRPDRIDGAYARQNGSLTKATLESLEGTNFNIVGLTIFASPLPGLPAPDNSTLNSFSLAPSRFAMVNGVIDLHMQDIAQMIYHGHFVYAQNLSGLWFRWSAPTRWDSVANPALVPLNTNSIITALPNTTPIDFPLDVIETYEEYISLSLKNLQSFPTSVFYDSAAGLGNLFFWPIPNNRFELHVLIKDTLQQFPSLNTPITLPPEYFEALLYNLAGRLQMLYQLPVNQGVIALARGALNTIRTANNRTPLLLMPAGLALNRGWAAHGAQGVIEGVFRLDEDVLG